MRIIVLLCFFVFFNSCKEDYIRPSNVSKVVIEPMVKDSTLSVRALEFNDEYILYGSADHFGKHALSTEFKINLNDLKNYTLHCVHQIPIFTQ